MKAVILAAGMGTRMRRPDPNVVLDSQQSAAADAGMKSLVPVGHPLLDYGLTSLADAGLREVCLVVGPEHTALRERYATTARPQRLTITFAIQERPLGTADAVLAAEAFAGDELFMVMNGDNLYPVEALRALSQVTEPAIAAFSARALVAEGNLTPARIATFPSVWWDDRGYLTNLELPSGTPHASGGAPLVRYVSMNAWVFGHRLFDACRAVEIGDTGEHELPDAVHLLLTRFGERMRVLRFDQPVLDLTSRSDIAVVTQRLLGREVRF